MTHQKKLFNRFDEYEIASMFTETSEEYFSKTCSPVRTRLVFKCILGILLAVNGFLSHWGPWTWPNNFYFLIFSVVFYHLGSFVYGKLSAISNTDGNMIGEFKLNGRNVVILLKIGENKEEYTLQVNDEKDNSLYKKVFVYYEYFTEDGSFLEGDFKKQLGVCVAELTAAK